MPGMGCLHKQEGIIPFWRKLFQSARQAKRERQLSEQNSQRKPVDDFGAWSLPPLITMVPGWWLLRIWQCPVQPWVLRLKALLTGSDKKLNPNIVAVEMDLYALASLTYCSWSLSWCQKLSRWPQKNVEISSLPVHYLASSLLPPSPLPPPLAGSIRFGLLPMLFPCSPLPSVLSYSLSFSFMK